MLGAEAWQGWPLRGCEGLMQGETVTCWPVPGVVANASGMLSGILLASVVKDSSGLP